MVADLDDPTRVVDPGHAAYGVDNRVGEGLVRRQFRLEYDGEAGPWVDLLSASPAVLEGLADETGWVLAEVMTGDGARYWAVLERALRQLEG